MEFQAEPCPKHGKALSLYCKEHDSIGCDDCIYTYREHISCKEVVYLPTSAQDVIKNIDVKEIKSKLRRTIEHLESIKIKQQNTFARLGADRNTCLKEINDHHEELLHLLEKIVQSSKDNVEQTFDRFSADLQRHQQDVVKCLVDLDSSEKRLERNQGNDFPLFVELKKCQNQLKATEIVSKESLENLTVRGFSIAFDDRLHVLLSELESLVTVLKYAPVQVKKKYQVDVSCKGDNDTCSIRGSCVLSDGSILLTDYMNNMLKCLDQHSLIVKDQRLILDCFDVCVINNSEVAVTQHNKTVVIVSVRPRLTLTRTIIMNHFCAYVAYSQGELFITDEEQTVYIYNMAGSLLRTVSRDDQSGELIFRRTRHIMTSASADKVYIADLDKGKITIDIEGRVEDKLISDKFHGLYDMCLDGMGGFFVCGYYSKNVVHVSADGQILTEVLTSSDVLVKPQSVCYDRHHKRLIVAKINSNQIYVCELEWNRTLELLF